MKPYLPVYLIIQKRQVLVKKNHVKYSLFFEFFYEIFHLTKQRHIFKLCRFLMLFPSKLSEFIVKVMLS